MRGLIRDNGTPRFNAVCERAEKAEAEIEALREDIRTLAATSTKAVNEKAELATENERLRKVCDSPAWEANEHLNTVVDELTEQRNAAWRALVRMVDKGGHYLARDQGALDVATAFVVAEQASKEDK